AAERREAVEGRGRVEAAGREAAAAPPAAAARVAAAAPAPAAAPVVVAAPAAAAARVRGAVPRAGAKALVGCLAAAAAPAPAYRGEEVAAKPGPPRAPSLRRERRRGQRAKRRGRSSFGFLCRGAHLQGDGISVAKDAEFDRPRACALKKVARLFRHLPDEALELERPCSLRRALGFE